MVDNRMGEMLKRDAENDKSKVEQIDSDKAPYVVLVGNVGSGKSTVVEKLTGVTGRSSSSAASATRTTEYKWTPDQQLLIADTPGTNPRKDKLEHNNEIAAALSYREVSKFLIVAKAHVRMDQTISDIQEYSERFVELPDDLVGVIVTHMDIEKCWNEREIREILDELELPDVIVTGKDISEDELRTNIINACHGHYKIDVGSTLYNTLFKIEESNRKILKTSNDCVRRFQKSKDDFKRQLEVIPQHERAEAIFEFLAFFRENQLEQVKKEMQFKLKFDFKSEKAAIQSGYLINMENQVKAVMEEYQEEARRYQMEPDYFVRSCPFCGTAWENPDIKECRKEKHRSESDVSMAKFVFGMSDKDGLVVKRKIGSPGCGKVIIWENMCPVPNDSKKYSTSSSQTEQIEQNDPAESSEKPASQTGQTDKTEQDDLAESSEKPAPQTGQTDKTEQDDLAESSEKPAPQTGQTDKIEQNDLAESSEKPAPQTGQTDKTEQDDLAGSSEKPDPQTGQTNKTEQDDLAESSEKPAPQTGQTDKTEQDDLAESSEKRDPKTGKTDKFEQNDLAESSEKRDPKTGQTDKTEQDDLAESREKPAPQTGQTDKIEQNGLAESSKKPAPQTKFSKAKEKFE